MPAHNPLRSANSVMAQRGAGNPVVLLDNGSYPGFSNFLNETWTWNGTDWTQAIPSIASAPTPLRADFALCYDGYNIMMFGGRGESETVGVLQDTWTFNGTTWTKEAPATVPFGRFKMELANITTAPRKTVMFGGSNVLNFLNETWVWNGSAKTWTLAAPAHQPPVRVDHMLADGPTFVVLFGGKNSNSLYGDTWKYDGTDWTQLTPTTPPSARAEACMAFDVANSNWVMFGGRDDFKMLAAETWTLNTAGTAWTKQAPAASPPPRVGASMCYDAQAGAVLMFGGKDPFQNFAYNDTWKWTGTNWVQL